MYITKTKKQNYILTTQQFKVRDVHPFIRYEDYRKGREGSRQRVQKTCFRCRHKFSDTEQTWLAVIQGYHNELFCEDCAFAFLNEGLE